MRRRFWFLSVLVVPGYAEADPAPPDSVYELPVMVVEAPKPVTRPGGSTAIEVSIDSLAVAVAAPVEDALRQLPAMHVRSNSRGEAEISVRGSESRQAAVFVDGAPLTLSWDGRTDVSIIPSTALRRLTYTRGLSSMLYGPNVVGGIVEMQVGGSLLGDERRHTLVTAGVDQVGAYAATAGVAIPFASPAGQWLARGGLGWRDSPGQPLAGGITEPDPGDDPDLRTNTDVQSLDGFASLGYQSEDGAWSSLAVSAYDAERGIPAELGVTDARFWRYPRQSRTLAVLSGGTGDRVSPLGGTASLQASFGYDRGRTDIVSYTARDYATIDGWENGKDRTLTARLVGEQSLGANGDLRAAFTVGDVFHTEILPDAVSDYEQLLWSGGVETRWWLIRDGNTVNTLRVTAGAAYDVAENPEAGGREPQGRRDQWGGRVGFSAGILGGDALVHAGLSSRARFPSLRELYSGALDRFTPNPDLTPETLVAREGGVTTHVGRGTLQLVGFHDDLSDAVVRITLEDRTFQRVNRDDLVSTGMEFILDQNLGRARLGADLTLQHVELTDNHARETHEPENLPEVYGGVRGEFPIVWGAGAFAEVLYTGSQFCIDPETGEDTELDAGAMVNAHLSRVWGASGAPSRIETRLAVDNVFDTALYDQCGLPRPGRRIRLELRIEQF